MAITYKEIKEALVDLGFEIDDEVESEYKRVRLNAINRSINVLWSTVCLPNISYFEDTDDRALQTKRLYARINRLGLVDRAIILLWLEGLSYEEIGAIVGISVKNVSCQLHRIKEELKKSHL